MRNVEQFPEGIKRGYIGTCSQNSDAARRRSVTDQAAAGQAAPALFERRYEETVLNGYIELIALRLAAIKNDVTGQFCVFMAISV